MKNNAFNLDLTKIDTIQQHLGFQTLNAQEEFFDLSFRDLFILFIIIRNNGVIGRNTFREMVNSYLKIELKPSSFYNLLNKLEEKKLITYSEEDKKISVTDLVPLIFTEITKMSFLGLIDTKNLITKLIGKILPKIEKSGYDTILLVPLEPVIDVDIYNQISNLAKDTYILSTDSEFKNLQTRSLNGNIFQSKIVVDEGKIREADNFFDAVMYLGYKTMKNSPETFKKLMKDSYRVIKKNGYLFLSSFLEVDAITDHIFLTYFRTVFSHNAIIDFVKEEDLLSDLKVIMQTNIKVQVIKEDGMIVGWGIKS